MSFGVKLIRFDHFTLVVGDLGRSEHFYAEILGLSKIERPDFDFPGLWFSTSNIQIHIIAASQLSADPPTPSPGKRLSRSVHFAFEVADMNQTRSTLLTAGIQMSDVKVRPDGVRQLFLEDPDGYVIELCQSKPLD